MPDVPLHFPWQVAEGGYRWIESHPADGDGRRPRPFLTDGRQVGAGGLRVRSYQPLTAFPGLFRVFADLEPTPDGIRAFADRFGPLGPNVAEPIPLHDRPGGGGVPTGLGEAASAWSTEILRMRQAVALWEAARRGDVAWLGRVIRWEPDGSGVRHDSHPDLPPERWPEERPYQIDRSWIASAHGVGGDVLARLMPGDLVRPALHHVQGVINQRLEGRASPRLLWSEDRARLGLYIVPDGLIGALWLQFARAVERDSDFRRCAECGIWFELAPGTARADKLYCSTPCRTRAYRKRQAEARRLYDEGRPIEAIARQLESEPATVRGWLERGSGEGRSGRGEAG